MYYDDGKYFSQSVVNLLDKHEISFEENEVNFDLYMRTPAGGAEFISQVGDFKEGQYLENAKQLEHGLREFLNSHTLDDTVEPFIEIWYRNRDFFRTADFNSVVDLIRDYEEWFDELKEFDKELVQYNLEQERDYSQNELQTEKVLSPAELAKQAKAKAQDCNAGLLEPNKIKSKQLNR